MKKCPFCAEEIRDEAIKCKHCRQMLGAQHATTARQRRADNLRYFVAVLCLICGLVLYGGSAVAQIEMKEGTRARALAMCVYNLVLGVSYVIASCALTVGTKRCYLLALYTSIIYIACTWTNELVQLAQGTQTGSLTDMGALFDILFWSGIPVFIATLSIAAARLQRSAANAKPNVRR